jgi:hypothetical protein
MLDRVGDQKRTQKRSGKNLNRIDHLGDPAADGMMMATMTTKTTTIIITTKTTIINFNSILIYLHANLTGRKSITKQARVRRKEKSNIAYTVTLRITEQRVVISLRTVKDSSA